MRENLIKSRLIAQLSPGGCERILDFGCGTGTLTLMIKKAGPGCDVYGIDIDQQMLEIAEMKARRDGAEIRFISYDGVTLPFKDADIDKVVTSLVIHHLPTDGRSGIFHEFHRVLKSGGELHVMDFGVQRTRYARFITSMLKYLEPLGENLRGMIPEYMRSAGFEDIEELHYETTFLGTVSFYRSKKF